MDVHDDWIPADTYEAFVERMPQACVELLLEHDGGVLLARRTNEPARGEWFWPGSRLYKGERLDDAARRVGREELGIEIEVREQLGAYAHFWEHSAEGTDLSRHTVNVVYRARPCQDDFAIDLDDQHDAYRFLESFEPGLHEHVREYLAASGALD